MAVAVGARSSATTSADDDDTSITWSHTCTGANLALVVFVTYRNNSSQTVSVTYNGTTMGTAITSQANGTSWTTHIFGMVAPTSGAHDIVVTFSAAVASGIAGAISLTGVNQTGGATTFPNSQATTSSDNTPTSTLTTSSVDNWCVGGWGESAASTALTISGAGHTEIVQTLDLGAITRRGGGSDKQAGASSQTLDWTTSGSPTVTMVAVEVLAAAAAADQEPSLVGGKLVSNSLLLKHMVGSGR